MQSTLLAVPNVSEGRDARLIDAIAAALALTRAARVLDVHYDSDHHRSVYTLAGPQGALADALLAGARVAVESIDVMRDPAGGGELPGQHPHVGAVDVVPIVYLDEARRGAACAEALVVADRIGEELGVPVFLYGELSGEESAGARTRAQLRRGGVKGLLERMAAEGGEEDSVVPDFGPPRMHPTAGATLVAARPPLVAFNVALERSVDIGRAREIAADLREGGNAGLPGVRVIAVALSGGIAQVSVNVERPFEVPLATVVEAVRARAPVASAELVGLAPAAALDGFPADVDLVGFDPERHVIENALGSIHGAGETHAQDDEAPR